MKRAPRDVPVWAPPGDAEQLARALVNLPPKDGATALALANAWRRAIGLSVSTRHCPRDPREVEELITRLRGHLMQLVALLLDGPVRDLPPGLDELIQHSRKLRQREAPIRLVDSIGYLIALAEAARDLVAYVTDPAMRVNVVGAVS